MFAEVLLLVVVLGINPFWWLPLPGGMGKL
jgi:hypothetical protein